MQRYYNNSRSESLWELSKTDAYEAYCISTSVELDTRGWHKHVQFLSVQTFEYSTHSDSTYTNI